jgi:Skp family chaperone for outer membrane proteins
MKTLLKSALVATMLLSGAQVAYGQAAPASGTVIAGIGVANLEAVVSNSNAFKAAQTQRQAFYKPQIDQANARADQIRAQLKTLSDKLNADSRAPNANQAALQNQYNQIQNIEQAGQQEVNKIMEPVSLSQAYVLELIGDKLDQATSAAMTKKGVTLLLQPQSVMKILPQSAYNLNQEIINELNVLIPSVQYVPPAGWLPREARAAQAAQQPAAAAPAAAPAARPATRPQPGGR